LRLHADCRRPICSHSATGAAESEKSRIRRDRVYIDALASWHIASFPQGGHEHLGADLIDTGRYGFARCPCGRTEQGYRHRQDGAAARAKSVQLNRRGDLTKHARDRHSCGDGDPLSKLSAASDNPCKRCVAHRSCTSYRSCLRFPLEQDALTFDAPPVARQRTIVSHHTMAGYRYRQRVRCAGLCHGSNRIR
jgi:hypothetical protein